MSPIHCRTDRYICCPFLFAESEVIMIITISRETGSGGHTVGQMLAMKMIKEGMKNA